MMKYFRLALAMLSLVGQACSGSPVGQDPDSGIPPLQVSDASVVLVDAGDFTDGGTVGGTDGGTREVSDAGPTPTLTLAVDVTGQASEVGQLCVAVFASSDGFPSEDSKAFHRSCIPMAQRPIRVVGLLEGQTYAFSVFHDENSNSTLDMSSFLGLKVPTEKYGFSNNASGSFGPPKWDDSKFTFGKDNASPVIRISKPL